MAFRWPLISAKRAIIPQSYAANAKPNTGTPIAIIFAYGNTSGGSCPEKIRSKANLANAILPIIRTKPNKAFIVTKTDASILVILNPYGIYMRC